MTEDDLPALATTLGGAWTHDRLLILVCPRLLESTVVMPSRFH
jgi:hypothetical protein